MNIDLRLLLSPDKFIPIYAIRSNKERDILGPFSAELHWTSLCNYKCIHCSYGLRRKQGKQLSKQVIKDVIQDLIYFKTKSVYISGGGEPTLVKDWHKYIEELVCNNIDVALITNGVNLNKMHMNILKKMKYIAISIYSIYENEYKAITGSTCFDTQFSLPSLIKSQDRSVVVGARCVLNKINYKSTFPLYKRAISSGYDYIIFIPAVDYEEKGISLTKREISEVKNIIKDNYSDFDFSCTNLDDILVKNISYYDGIDYQEGLSSSQIKCAAIEIRANVFISYDGGVYLCQPHIEDKRYCIGNVNEKCLKDIWNSPRHKKVIDILNKNFSSRSCRSCRSIAFNRRTFEYSNSLLKSYRKLNDNFI